MKIRIKKMNKKHYSLINFDHLMKIYEFNYQLIHKIFSFNFRSNKLSTFVTGKQILQYEPITISKYTSIFRLYYKFVNNTPYPSEYYIKPHLIFTLYNDDSASVLSIQLHCVTHMPARLDTPSPMWV